MVSYCAAPHGWVVLLIWHCVLPGPVVRTGPNELSFIGANAWEDIYGVQVRRLSWAFDRSNVANHSANQKTVANFQKDPAWLAVVSPKDGQTDVSMATHQRNALGATFTNEALLTQEHNLRSHVNKLLEKLRNNETKKATLSETELILNMVQLISAGSETTASLLTGWTYFLLSNPSVHRRVVKEVRNAFSSAEEIKRGNAYLPRGHYQRSATPGLACALQPASSGSSFRPGSHNRRPLCAPWCHRRRRPLGGRASPWQLRGPREIWAREMAGCGKIQEWQIACVSAFWSGR